jgi:lipoprotein NlpI
MTEMNVADIITNPGIVIMAVAGCVAWVVTTWLRVRHGYPLEGSWGQELKPVHNDEALERVKLVTQENAQLMAEVGALKDRVATLERIATDSGTRLAREIDDLRH